MIKIIRFLDRHHQPELILPIYLCQVKLIYFMDKTLIRKYNVPGPRYTSFPPVPAWNPKPPTILDWKNSIRETFNATNQKEGISLYIHLPFCESLCTYCGCNTRITVNHAIEKPYIDSILKEWQLYLDTFSEKPKVAQIHLGGGTPTFFSPENLHYLISSIYQTIDVLPGAELGFEGHPNSTTKSHLATLHALGFTRLSLGIQDFDYSVQKKVNRIQSFETVAEVVTNARTIGYNSINFDLIYGLPLQTPQTIEHTIKKVSILKPNRIAFYSYAHVPWTKPGQRGFVENDLPGNGAKRALYELGKQMLEDLEYKEIGMDHFSLKSDELYLAATKGTLHRNFMGYTPRKTSLLVGLGASSIGDSWTTYAQNVKVVELYQKLVQEGKIPIFKGHHLTAGEQNVRHHICNIMCNYSTEMEPGFTTILTTNGQNQLKTMADDGLINLKSGKLDVLPKGRPFVRNVCMAIDPFSKKEQPIYSKTI